MLQNGFFVEEITASLSYILVAGCNILVAGCNILIAGCNILIAGCNILVAGCNILVAGCNILIAGCNILVAGYNILVAGYNILVAGYNILVAGCNILRLDRIFYLTKNIASHNLVKANSFIIHKPPLHITIQPSALNCQLLPSHDHTISYSTQMKLQ